MSDNPNVLANGSKLKGKLDYTIESCLGQGGFGITYLAKGTMQIGNIKQKVLFTVKEFFMQHACRRLEDGSMEVTPGNEESVSEHKKSFQKEAERLNSLNEHPGIVNVNEIFSQNNTVYYVMEYLGDMNLGTYIEQQGGKLSEKEAARIFLKLAEALQYLHSKKIMHLDVKPANVMMKRDEDTEELIPVLIDFGLALHFGRSNNPTSENKAICCTDGFSPQEQYLGISTFEPAADIYALGATVLYMLSGTTPPMANKMNDQYVDTTLGSAISTGMRQMIKTCMAKLPEQRYKSMDALIEHITLYAAQPEDELAGGATRIIGMKPTTGKPKKPAKSAPKQKEDGGGTPTWVKPLAMVLSGAVLCAVIVLVALNFMGGDTKDPGTATPTPESVAADSTQNEVKAEAQQEEVKQEAAKKEEKAKTEEKKQEGTKTEVAKKEEPKQEATVADEPSEKTLDLGHATYVGEVSGGKPHGYGTLTFKSEHQIESYDAAGNVAEAGDVVTGTFNAGHLTKGRWKKSSGETKTLIIGN